MLALLHTLKEAESVEASVGELEAQRLADDVTLERREGEALAHWLP